MRVKDVMTSPAVTVAADSSVKDALSILDERRLTALPVVDAAGFIVGVVSEADLLRGAVPHDPRSRMWPVEESSEHAGRVGEVMSAPAMTVTVDSDLRDAVAVMTSTAVKSLPVIDDGRVVGVVSRSDVVHLMARPDESIRQDVVDLLSSAGLDCEVVVDGGIVTLSSFRDPAQGRAARAVAGSVTGVVTVQAKM